MEINKIPMIAISAIVAIIMISVVAVPIISSVSATTVTEENTDPIIRMSELKAEQEITFSWEKDTDKLTIDGKEVPITSSFYPLASENLVILINVNSLGDKTAFVWSTDFVDKVEGNWTITISKDKSYNYTRISPQTGTLAGTTYVYDDKGQYAMFSLDNAPVKINTDAKIGILNYSFGNESIAVKNATLSETIVCEKWTNTNAGEPTKTTDATATLTLGVSDFENLKILESIKIDGQTWIGLKVIAPLYYEHEISGSIQSLISVIPILLVVGLMVGIVSLYRYSKS